MTQEKILRKSCQSVWHDNNKWRTLICEYKAAQGDHSTISWGSILLGTVQWALLICQLGFLVCSQTNSHQSWLWNPTDAGVVLVFSYQISKWKGWLWNWTKRSSKVRWEQDHINPCTVFSIIGFQYSQTSLHKRYTLKQKDILWKHINVSEW